MAGCEQQQPGSTMEEDGKEKVCIIPIGWRRELDKGAVAYFSSSGFKLTSIQEIKAYIATEGTCKCGLQCPLMVERVFNFDCKVKGKIRLAEDVIKDSDLTKLCNHKRKIIAMATLQNSVTDLEASNGHDSKRDCKANTKGTKRSRTKAKVSACQQKQLPSLSVSKLLAMQQGGKMSGPLPSMDSFTANRFHATSTMPAQYAAMNNPRHIHNFPIQGHNTQLAGDLAFDALLAARTMEKLNGYTTSDTQTMQGIAQHVSPPGIHREMVVTPNGDIFPGVVPLASNLLSPGISPGSSGFTNVQYQTSPQFLHGKPMQQIPGIPHVSSFVPTAEPIQDGLHQAHGKIQENHLNHLRRGLSFPQAEGQFYPPPVPLRHSTPVEPTPNKLSLPVLGQSMITSFPASSLLTAAARAQIAEKELINPSENILSNQIKTVPNVPKSVPLLKDGPRKKMLNCKESDTSREEANSDFVSSDILSKDCVTSATKNVESVKNNSSEDNKHLVLKRNQDIATSTSSVPTSTVSEPSPKKPKFDESIKQQSDAVVEDVLISENSISRTAEHDKSINVTPAKESSNTSTTCTIEGVNNVTGEMETKKMQLDHMIRHPVQMQHDQEWYLSMIKNQSSMMNQVPPGFNHLIGGMPNNLNNCFQSGCVPPNIMHQRNVPLPSLSEKSTKEWLAEMNIKNMQQTFVNFQHQQRIGFGSHMLPGNRGFGQMHPSMLQNMLQSGGLASQMGNGMGFQQVPNPIASVGLQTTPIGTNVSRPNRRKSPGRQYGSVKKSPKSGARSGPQKVKDILAMRKEKEKEIERERGLLEEAEKQKMGKAEDEAVYHAVIDASGTGLKVLITSGQETPATIATPPVVSIASDVNMAGTNSSLHNPENLTEKLQVVDNCKNEIPDVQPISFKDQSEVVAIKTTSPEVIAAQSELSSLPSNDISSNQSPGDGLIIAGDDYKSTIVDSKAQVVDAEDKNQRTVCQTTITPPLPSEPMCSHSIKDENRIDLPCIEEIPKETKEDVEQSLDSSDVIIHDSLEQSINDCDKDKSDRPQPDSNQVPKDNVNDAIETNVAIESEHASYELCEVVSEKRSNDAMSKTRICEASQPTIVSTAMLTVTKSIGSCSVESSEDHQCKTNTDILPITGKILEKSIEETNKNVESTLHDGCNSPPPYKADLSDDKLSEVSLFSADISDKVNPENSSVNTPVDLSDINSSDPPRNKEVIIEQPHMFHSSAATPQALKLSSIADDITEVEVSGESNLLNQQSGMNDSENTSQKAGPLELRFVRDKTNFGLADNKEIMEELKEPVILQTEESPFVEENNSYPLPKFEQGVINISNNLSDSRTSESHSVHQSMPETNTISDAKQEPAEDKTRFELKDITNSAIDEVTCDLDCQMVVESNIIDASPDDDGTIADSVEAMQVEPTGTLMTSTVKELVDDLETKTVDDDRNLDKSVQLENLVQDSVIGKHDSEEIINVEEENSCNFIKCDSEINTDECSEELNNTKISLDNIELSKLQQQTSNSGFERLSLDASESLQENCLHSFASTCEKVAPLPVNSTALPPASQEADNYCIEPLSESIGNVDDRETVESDISVVEVNTTYIEQKQTVDEETLAQVKVDHLPSNQEVCETLELEKEIKTNVIQPDVVKHDLTVSSTDQNKNLKSTAAGTIGREQSKAALLSERLENSEKEFTLVNLVNGELGGRLQTRKEKQKDVIKSAIEEECLEISQHNSDKPEDIEEACKENTNCTHESSPPSPGEDLPPSFGIGDLVWGQIRGCASWPGKVVCENDVKGHRHSETGKIWVKWFGDHTFTQVEPDKLKNLTEGLEAHHTTRARSRRSRKITSSLEIAIQEAMTELDKKMEQVRAPLQY
ncbi:uncharacterized protein LOC117125068 isoform X2 [Anneissia japonica]|uniref:uncharacterized protein LOC117125068 isoform X2 n=1 Tax=Anneissia japonica TaxID=1529436 RepID=UPI001425A891|nr:uncharacterized protein LOC117125068 isoform X2 [Anneissia japonica]XP_033127336.1 uncharacterized protein LOC117125068 isoform X2 [Anneissia japonica]